MTTPPEQPKQKPSPAEEIADLVADLVDGVRTDEKVTRYRQVNRGNRTALVTAMEGHRTNLPGLIWQLSAVQSSTNTVPVHIYKDILDRNKRRTGRRELLRTEHRTVPGVIRAGAAVPGGSAGWDEDGALNPGSGRGFESAPPVTEASELLDTITSEARQLLADLRGTDAAARRSLPGMLRELVGLVLNADTDTGEAVTRKVRGWANAARVLLHYDAPVTELRDLYCRECEGVLYVRADASTPVWCGGHPEKQVAGPARPDPLDPEQDAEEWPVVYPAVPGCGVRYPQGSWVSLLEQARKQEGAQHD